MNMFRIWVLGLLVFILAGCSASIDGSKYQQTTPPLSLEAFFCGRCEGLGHCSEPLR